MSGVMSKKRFFGDGRKSALGALASYNIGEIKSQNGTYTGECHNGEPYGWGTLKTTCGSVYTGSWKGAHLFTGAVAYSDGVTYKGSVSHGKRHGKGIVTKTNGDQYEGDFQNGLMHGKGVRRYANGNVCRGEFSNDRIHGKAVIAYASGHIIDGTFANGKPVGELTVTPPSGVVYKKYYN
jgi:hypothetical protein